MGHALLVCKHHVLARSLVAILDGLHTFDEIRIMQSSCNALLELRRRPFDMVVLMEGFLGCPLQDLIYAARAGNSEGKILVLLDSSAPEAVSAAYSAGANACLPRISQADVLDLAIRCILKNITLIGSEEMDALQSLLPPRIAPQDRLSPLDRQIVLFVTQGLSNSEIAGRLYYSENTIKFKVSALMNRFGVTNRVQLAVHAVRNRLI